MLFELVVISVHSFISFPLLQEAYCHFHTEEAINFLALVKSNHFFITQVHLSLEDAVCCNQSLANVYEPLVHTQSNHAACKSATFPQRKS